MTTSVCPGFKEQVSEYRSLVQIKRCMLNEQNFYYGELQPFLKDWRRFKKQQPIKKAMKLKMFYEEFATITAIITKFEQFLKFEKREKSINRAQRQLIYTYLQQIEVYLAQLETFEENISKEYTSFEAALQTFCETDLQRLHTTSKSYSTCKKSWDAIVKQYDYLAKKYYEGNSHFENGKKIIQAVFKKIDDMLLLDKSFMEPLFKLQVTEASSLLQQVQLQAMEKNSKKPFLVNFWTWTLQKLEMVSLFYLIRTILFPKYTSRNFKFVDSWLLGHTILALLYVLIANVQSVPNVVKYILLIYGCLRMFEILIYQLNVILVHPYNSANYSLNSYRRMTIALIHNFIEIIFWFAGTFVTLQFITDSTVPLAVYTSFTHMVTYSMELDDSQWTMLAIFILQFQAAIGVFMTVLSLARFVSLFPQPASKDMKEQEANEVRHTKLIEEINNLKATVEKNSARITHSEHEIDQIQHEGEHQHT